MPGWRSVFTSPGGLWGVAAIGSFVLASLLGLIQSLIAAASTTHSVRVHSILPIAAVFLVVLVASTTCGLICVRRLDAGMAWRALAWRTGVLLIPAIAVLSFVLFLTGAWRNR